jgi:alpha-L-rhamnosidase
MSCGIKVIIFIVLFAYSCKGGPLPPFNLKCERNLVGLSFEQLDKLDSVHYFSTESSQPLLSWSIAHTERGAIQKSFRVLVSTDKSFANVVWDSGLVKSNDLQQEIQYNGLPLKGGTLYLWKVTWWDADGHSAASKEIGHFFAVRLTENDWDKAKWISAPDGVDTAPKFVKQISAAGKTTKKATLYISGLGYFRVTVNGVDIHKQADPPIFLAPGWTNYEIRVPYMVLDITKFMNNITSFMICLGTGWRNTSEFEPRDPSPVPDKVPSVLRLILTVEFTTSDIMTVYSDNTWDVQTSNIITDTVYNGETYDATLTPKTVGKAVETGGPAGMMYLPTMPYIAETGIIDNPIAVTLDPKSKDDHNMQIVDFGNNSAGVIVIKVDGVPTNQVFQMEHAEVPMHPPYGAKDGSLFFGNLRSAKQTDVYTSNGNEKVYQPTFTYHGFRYALITNYPRKLTSSDLYKVRVNTNLKQNSILKVSSDLLNNIQENVIRGHLSNLMSVPTDCDQRNERLGWMGDAGLSADAMALNFHMDSFLPHRTMLMKDEQINGFVPDVVPYYKGGGRPADPSWGAAYPQTVWVLWKYYGDVNTAKEYYPDLLAYIDAVETQVPSSGIGQLGGRYGDWCPPPPVKRVGNSYPSAFSFMQNIQQMMEIAQALGDTGNTTKLKNLFDKHAMEFNKAFYSDYKYSEDMQISYILPLALGIVPQEDKEKVITNFLNKIASDKDHVTSGIVGVKPLLPVLTDIKQHDLAMTIVNQVDYPSWGYMIHNPDEPATTIWELWNSNSGSSGMDSRNHHMFSSVSSWLQTDMIGLKQCNGSYGFKELDLYPAPSLDLSSATISLEHPKMIKYSWHRQGGLQCGKAAEDQSVVNPTLPKHGGLRIRCGEGKISQVQFASYGNPVGTCGYHHVGECHSIRSKEIVENLCMNKTECLIPSDSHYWGDPCPGKTKWLTAAVVCTTDEMLGSMYRYSSLKVNLSIPIGSHAHLNIPTYGASDLIIWDNNRMIYDSNALRREVKGVESIQRGENGDQFKMKLISGDYNLTIRGAATHEVKRVITTSSDNDQVTLKCSNDLIITGINWASYGNPRISIHGDLTPGACHSRASRRVLERNCLGKNSCMISLEDYGRLPCTNTGNRWNLIAQYSCNKINI